MTIGSCGDGSNAYTDTNPNNCVFTIPPSSVRNIGDELNERGVSWAYLGDQFRGSERLADVRRRRAANQRRRQYAGKRSTAGGWAMLISRP